MQVFMIILTAFRGLKLIEIAQILADVFDFFTPDQKDAILDRIEKRIATNQAANPVLKRSIALASLTALRAFIGVPDDDTDQLNPI